MRRTQDPKWWPWLREEPTDKGAAGRGGGRRIPKKHALVPRNGSVHPINLGLCEDSTAVVGPTIPGRALNEIRSYLVART